MSIRNATPDDLPRIADIHRRRFPTQFVGRLPSSLIAKFYAAQLPRSILLVHGDKGAINGFVHGGQPDVMAAGRSEFLRANLGRCLWQMTTQPQLCWSSMSSILGGRFSRRRPHDHDSLPNCCLRCLAIDQDCEGKGYATALVMAFESVIRSEHASYFLYVYKSNLRAVALYEKLGFKRQHENGAGITLVKQLGQDDSR
jgi:ribosomal protein S18 acetylase RimI-like enzyme